MCERRYRVGEQWYNLRPDALAEYRMGSQQVRFWLEWDRGTMNVRDLAVKFNSYAHYIDSREWAREHSMLPVLICVAPDIAQEKRMQRVAQDSLTLSKEVVVWTTTAMLLKDHGPLAPIWLQRKPQSSQVAQSDRSFRECLFKISNITLLDRQNLMPSRMLSHREQVEENPLNCSYRHSSPCHE
jgi:hypothetical protein